MAQQLYHFLQKETNLDSFVVPSKQRIIQNISTAISKIREPLSILRWASIFVCRIMKYYDNKMSLTPIFILLIFIFYQAKMNKVCREKQS